jgi:hypothetical protein
VEAQLLGSLPDHGAHPSAADTLLRFFGYSGLFFNLGATLSAILLLVAVASLPTAARQVYMTCSHGYPRKIFNSHGPHVAELNRRLLQGDGETYILRAFGIAKGWGIMLRHCILCFLAGCVCCFLHVGINLWLSESKLVAAIIMPSAVFGSVPPLLMFSFYMDSPACDDCIEERCAIHFSLTFTTLTFNHGSGANSKFEIDQQVNKSFLPESSFLSSSNYPSFVTIYLTCSHILLCHTRFAFAPIGGEGEGGTLE